MSQEFVSKNLAQGVNLYINPTKKFKTILVQLFLHRQLDKELATLTALLPMVLMRGSKNYPTTLEITRSLEKLYGAEIAGDIMKKGERQIVTFALDVVDDQFTPGNQDVLKDGLRILKDIIYNPTMEEQGFKGSYVNQEKEQLKKQIKGLINDKMSMAVERCLQEMCKEERYGTFKYGYLEKIEDISPVSLYEYYQNFIAKSPIDIFVVGDVDVEGIQSLIEEVFTFSTGVKHDISPAVVNREVKETKVVEEKMNVKQGKLSLGYRTNIPYGDDIFPLLYYNGILGGFPHSKLFQNVREKESLAYYAFSRLEKTKGIMLISSGIEIENYEKALDIINKQVANMVKGEISDYEFENTKKGLLSQAILQEDNPYQQVSSVLEGVINDRIFKREEVISKLESVTKADVVRVAQNIKLDTIYFLRN